MIRREIKFPHKAILTRGMLQELYDNPRELMRLMFSEYSDGIISGFDYLIKDGNLILTSGIFRLNEEIYLLHEDLNISELAERNSLKLDESYYITFEEKIYDKEPCLTEKRLELKFSMNKPQYNLGSFVYLGAKNFILPAFTEESVDKIFLRGVFNLFEVPFAQRNCATFHPLLFRFVKDFLSHKKDKTPFDYALLIHLQNSDTVSMATLAEYIKAENKTATTENRKEFFNTFLTCLRESKFAVTTYTSNNELIKIPPQRTRRGKLI